MARYSSERLRRGRFSEAGRTYLITTATAARQCVFADWIAGRAVVAELRSVHDDGLVESLAWVLMPDHLHWLLTLRSGGLPALMKRVKGRSAASLKSSFGHRGAVWQSGYHDRALRRESDIIVAARYLVGNPVRAGIVTRIGDYPLWDAVWL